MDPIQAFLGVLVSRGVEFVASRLRPDEPSFARSVAAQLVASGLATKDEGNAVANWLARPEITSALLDTRQTPETFRTISIEALKHELGAPSPEIASRAYELAKAVFEHLGTLVGEEFEQTRRGLSGLAAGQTEIRHDLDELKAGQDFLADMLINQPASPSIGLAPNLSLFRPSSWSTVKRAFREDGGSWSVLESWLGDEPAKHGLAVTKLVNSAAPTWFNDLGPATLELLGDIARQRSHHGAASELYERAAARSSEQREYLLTRAAACSFLDDRHEHAKERIDLALKVETTPSLFTQGVGAWIDGDGDNLRELGVMPDLDVEQAGGCLLAIICGNALLTDNQLTAAKELLSRALPFDGEDRTVELAHAQVELMEAAHTNVAHERHRLGTAALASSLLVRDARREEGLDSSEALVLAARAAMVVGDHDRAIQLVTTEALETERRSAAVNELAILFASVDEDIDVDPETDFAVAIQGSWVVSATIDERRRLALEAVELAEDDAQLGAALTALADTGASRLPRMAELQHEHQRDELRGLAALRSGDHGAAIALLRPLAGRYHRAAFLLGEAYEASGDIERAIDLARVSAEKFDRVVFVSRLARLLEESGNTDEAIEAVQAQVLATSSDWETGALRFLLGQLLARAGRTDEAIASLSSPGSVGHVGSATILFGLLMKQGRLDEAGKHALRYEIPATNSDEAMQLLHAYLHQPGTDALTRAIELLEQYVSSEHVLGQGLALIFRRATQQVPQALSDRVAKLLDQLHEMHPDNPHLMRFAVPTDDPVQAMKTIDDFLATKKANDSVELVERATVLYESGQIPLEVYARFIGKDPIDLVSVANWLPFKSSAGLGAHHPAMCEVALGAINGPVILDFSALVVLAHLGSLRNAVLGGFSRILVPAELNLYLAQASKRRTNGYFVQIDGVLTLAPLSDEDRLYIDTTLKDLDALVRATERTSPVNWDLDGPAKLLNRISGRGSSATDHWMSCLGLAVETGVPILSCELGVAQLALEFGVPVFDLGQLIMAMQSETVLQEPIASELISSLFRLGYSQLPMTPMQLTALAISYIDEPQGLRKHLSDSDFWRNAQESLSALTHVFQHMGTQSAESCTDTIQAAARGLRLRTKPHRRSESIGFLFAQLYANRGLDETETAAVIERLRSSSVDDPLPAIVRAFATLLTDVDGSSTLLMSAFSELEEEDRHLVAETLLDLR